MFMYMYMFLLQNGQIVNQNMIWAMKTRQPQGQMKVQHTYYILVLIAIWLEDLLHLDLWMLERVLHWME